MKFSVAQKAPLWPYGSDLWAYSYLLRSWKLNLIFFCCMFKLPSWCIIIHSFLLVLILLISRGLFFSPFLFEKPVQEFTEDASTSSLGCWLLYYNQFRKWIIVRGGNGLHCANFSRLRSMDLRCNKEILMDGSLSDAISHPSRKYERHYVVLVCVK